MSAGSRAASRNLGAVKGVERRCGPGEAIFAGAKHAAGRESSCQQKIPPATDYACLGESRGQGARAGAARKLDEGLRAERLVRPGEPPAAPTGGGHDGQDRYAKTTREFHNESR